MKCHPQDVADLVADGLSDPQIAEQLDVHPSTVLRVRVAYGIPSGWQPNRPQHGTNASYAADCRCLECRRANAERGREYRARKELERREARRKK